MKNVELLLFLLGILLVFSACHKDDDDSRTQTKAELIADKNWVITGHTSKLNNDPVKDEYKNYAVCDADDLFRFSKNGTFENIEGTTKCDSSNLQVVSQGTWRIHQDDLILTEEGNTPENLKIVELTKSKMVLSATESFPRNTYVQVLTFTNK